MSLSLWIEGILGLIVGLVAHELTRSKAQARRWQKLEQRQAGEIYELRQKLADVENRYTNFVLFRQRPGMETVSDTVAKKIMDIEAENLSLTKELNKIRLQAAKYMDLYREERYKPNRKHT